MPRKGEEKPKPLVAIGQNSVVIVEWPPVECSGCKTMHSFFVARMRYPKGELPRSALLCVDCDYKETP